MHIDAEFSAFLTDKGRHGRLRAAGRRWAQGFRADPHITGLSAVLARMSDHLPERARDFADMLRPWTTSLDWVDGCVRRCREQAASDPFAQIPLGIQTNRVFLGLEIAVQGRANCVLSLIDSDVVANTRQNTIVFDNGYSLVLHVGGGAVTVERFVKNTTDGRIVSEGPATLPLHEPVLIDCEREQLRLIAADSDAVLLRFSCARKIKDSRITEYDTASGRALRTGIGNVATSRKAALLQFVAMQQNSPDLHDALIQLVDDDDRMVRWEAARHLISRYPAAADGVVRVMAANDPDDEVRHLAGSVVAMCFADGADCGA
ncbi:MAG: HEAT repeat domain-containing protein [Sphingopyxis sp.]